MEFSRSERRARRHFSIESEELLDVSPPSSNEPSPSPMPSLDGEGSPHSKSKEWRSIDDEALSGRLIEVRSIKGEIKIARMKTTRGYDSSVLKWVPKTFWFDPEQFQPLSFEPVEYRLLS